MTSLITPTLVKVEPPSGFNWPFMAYPLNIYRNGTQYGAQISTDFVPEKYINANCYLKVYDVSIATGNDSNTGIGLYPGQFSSATAVKSINQAITLGNATNAPYMVVVQSGIYPRANGFMGNASSIAPTQDTAFFAVGGTVVTGAFDALTWTLTTGTTYQATRSSVMRVVDLLNNTGFGGHVDLTLAASLTACEATPGTWYDNGTTLYVNRADGAAVTNTNTRAYLSAQVLTLINTTGNIYLKGFALEGGAISSFYSEPTTVRAGNSIFSNCTFGYSGTIGVGGTPVVAVNNVNGLAAFVNCTAYSGVDDAFNFHWNLTAGPATLYPLTINCTANGMGLGPTSTASSVNGLTWHDGIIGIDIGGDYEYNFGGNVATILGVSTTRATQCWCVGTKAAMSRGDIPLQVSNAQPPRDYWMDGMVGGVPCQMWLDGCLAGSSTSDSNAAQSLCATTSAVIYTRNVVNASGTSSGTISSY